MARLKYWIPALCVAILISSLSTHYFSGEQTARFIIPVLHRLLPAATPRSLRLIHIAIRKAAHVIEFGTFSIAVFHGVRGERSGWSLRWAILTLVIAVLYAGLDEWHQSFVPLREPRFRDVLIDSAGALLAQFFVWIFAQFRRRSPAQSSPVERASHP
jgi:VanZ family protein